MNEKVSSSLAKILIRLFPKEEHLIITPNDKWMYIEIDDRFSTQLSPYEPLKLHIETLVLRIPEKDNENDFFEIQVSLPYKSDLIKCLNPKINSSSMFETNEVLFSMKLHPKLMYYILEDEEIGYCEENIVEIAIIGASLSDAKPHIFNDNIEIKEEYMDTLEKNLTLWALGTKEGEQSLAKYLEKTAIANGASM